MIDAHAGMGPTRHLLTNFQVATEGNHADSVTYVHAVTVLASHPDDWMDTIGTYEDRFHSGTEGWRITSRIFRTTRTILSPSLSADHRGSNEPEAAS
jgi:hypothetical protein